MTFRTLAGCSICSLKVLTTQLIKSFSSSLLGSELIQNLLMRITSQRRINIHWNVFEAFDKLVMPDFRKSISKQRVLLVYWSITILRISIWELAKVLLISQFCLPLIWRSSGKWSIEPPFFRVRLVIFGPGFFPICQTDQPETRETNQWEMKRSHVIRLKQHLQLHRSLLRTFRPKFRLLHCEQGEKTRIFENGKQVSSENSWTCISIRKSRLLTIYKKVSAKFGWKTNWTAEKV